MIDTTSLTISTLLVRSLRRWGDRVAFSGHGGEITYRGALDMFARMQAVFKASKVEPGSKIALLYSNRGDAWLAGSAAQALGLAVVALHPLGALEDHLFVIEDSEADYLIVDGSVHLERGGELQARSDRLKQTFTVGAAEYGIDLLSEIERVGSANAVVDTDSSLMPQIYYTGGTTGKPKGALRSHRSLVGMTNGILTDFEIPASPRYLSVAPISHVGGTKLLPILLRGGQVHMHHGFDPDKVFNDISGYKLSMTLLVPTMIYMLLDHPGFNDADLSSLELLLYGASPMSPARLAEGLDRAGQIFSQLYGQSEGYPIAVLPREYHDLNKPDILASCGFPCSTVDLELMDNDTNPVAFGEVGEICIKAPQMMDGYWKRPDQTEETLEKGWLHTGDMARFDEQGLLYIVDRKKDMIISGGFNIYPKEVEDVISANSDVAQVAVIGAPDEKWGESVVAVVEPKEGKVLDPEAIIADVKAQKGSLMAPKAVRIVDKIPETAVGKPDKKLLRDSYSKA